jgi:hypothetical protein
MYKYRYSCQVLMRLGFSLQIFEKYTNIECHENPFIGSRVVPCGRTNGPTDMTMLIVAFFANAPEMRFLLESLVFESEFGLTV